MSDKISFDYALKHHKPFYVVNLGTTGIDNSTIKDNYPTRIYITGYEYNETTYEYEPVHIFKEFADVPADTLKRIEADIANGGFNPFENGGVTMQDWKDKALSIPDFCQKLDDFMKSVPADALMVANFNNSGFYNYLRKDYDNPLKAFDVNLVSITDFAKELTGKKAKVEELATLVSPELLVNGKLPDAESKMQTAFKYIIDYGTKTGLLINDFDKTTLLQKQDRSDKARSEYEAKSVGDKIDSLKEMKVVNGSDTPNLDSLTDILMQKNGNKGFTTLIVATTGLQADDRPIQLCAITYELEGNKAVPIMGMNFDVQADKRWIDVAMNGKFDAFAYTGIEKEKYLKGVNEKGEPIKTEEEAISLIMKYFDTYNLKDYPLISNGTAKTGNAYAMNALSKLGNLPSAIIDVPFVDFTQVIKEHIGKNGDNSVLLGDNKDIKNFSLDSVYMSRGNATLSGSTTTRKVKATIELVGEIFNEVHGINKVQVQQKADTFSRREDMVRKFKDMAGGDILAGLTGLTSSATAAGAMAAVRAARADMDYDEDEDYDDDYDDEDYENGYDEDYENGYDEDDPSETPSYRMSSDIKSVQGNAESTELLKQIVTLLNANNTLLNINNTQNDKQNAIFERQNAMFMGLLDVMVDNICERKDLALKKIELLKNAIDGKDLD